MHAASVMDVCVCNLGRGGEESVGDKFDRLEVRCGCACFEAGTCQFRTSTLTALEVDRTVNLWDGAVCLLLNSCGVL